MRPSPSLACARQTMNVPLDKRPSWHWYRRASAQSHHLEDQEFSGFRARNQGKKKHTHSHFLPGIFFAADPGDAYESAKFGSSTCSLMIAEAAWKFAASRRAAQLMR